MHVVHDCPNGKEVVAALQQRYGYQSDLLPLNTDKRRNGESRHPTCPYCGADTSKMEPADQQDVFRLSVDPRGSAASRSARNNVKDAEVLELLRSMRSEIESLKKKKGGSD